MSEAKEMVAVGERGLQFQTMDGAFRFADAVVKSGHAPKGDTAAGVLVKIQAGWELGLSPMRSLQNLVVINGRVSMMEKLATALVRSSGKVAPDGQLTVTFSGSQYEDDYTCTVTSRRRDEANENETTFSVRDAKLARLWGENVWKFYPKRMLRARAMQHHLQDYYSDVTMGFALTETALEDGVIQVHGRQVRGIGRPIVEAGSVSQADPLFPEPNGESVEVVNDDGSVG